MVRRARARSHALPVRAVDDSERAFSTRGRGPAPVDGRDGRAVDLGRRVGGVGHVVGFVHVVDRFAVFGHGEVERGLVLLAALFAAPVEEEER